MKVKLTTLQRFINSDYIVNGVEEKRVTVTNKIPFNTYRTYKGTFPSYLKNYRDYYFEIDEYCYALKEEYKENRPTYSIEVTKYEYDVEFTKSGKEVIKERLALHEKNAEFYKKMMESL